MAVSLDQIEGFLKEIGFKYTRVEENQVIIAGFSENETTAALFFRTIDSGDVLQIKMEPRDKNEMFDISSNHKYLNLILPQLLKENYDIKFGNWEYNPENGDLRFAVEIPFMDAVMTKNQFIRIMSVFSSALEAQERIMHIAKTGEVKEDETSKLMAEFAEFLKARQSKQDKEDEDGI